jgi:signal peptidase I
MRRVLALLVIGFSLAVGALVVLAFAALGLGAVHAYRIPSSAMEPTLHCARPSTGCEAAHTDRVLGLSWGARYGRGDIVFFATPAAAELRCGASGTFVKRIVGLPGETVQERVIDGAGFIFIDGQKLDEPYVQQSRRNSGPEKTWRVPQGAYFLLGDNRASSCDSRIFGSVPADSMKAKLVVTYWPPDRISFR